METRSPLSHRLLAPMLHLSEASPYLLVRDDSSDDGSSDSSSGGLSDAAIWGIAVGSLFFLLWCCQSFRKRRTRAAAPVRAAPVLPLHINRPASPQNNRPIFTQPIVPPPPYQPTEPPTAASEVSAVLGGFKECKVCLQDLSLDRFSNQTPTKTCTHQVEICTDCIRNHVDQRLASLGTVAPFCPTTSCRRVMTHYDIQRAASEESFDRYDRLLLRKAVGNQQGFVWCKNAQCDAGQYHIIPDEPRHSSLFHSTAGQCQEPDLVVCIACGSASCFRHDVPWHEGMTCKEYERSVARPFVKNESKTIKTIQKKTKACPKCNTPVEKNGGCDNMYCRPPGGCGHHFQWKHAQTSQVPNRPNARPR